MCISHNLNRMHLAGSDCLMCQVAEQVVAGAKCKPTTVNYMLTRLYQALPALKETPGNEPEVNYILETRISQFPVKMEMI